VQPLGKIFDALEKSGKESDKRVLPAQRVQKAEQNVVRLKKKIPVRPGGGRKISREPKKVPETTGDTVGIDANLVCALTPRSFEAEQFKMLRTRILYPMSGAPPPRTIMVTSAMPGEGKSFVAANMAVSIAQNINEHVLLMDCDLRLPSIADIFGVGSVAGLSEYLANGMTIPELLIKTMIEKLTILPAGQPPENPSELLSSEKMVNLLEDVKNRYQDRYVIIDLPPPYLTSEANALARQVDGIILVVKSGGSDRKMISSLVEMLGKEKILGVVFNGVAAQPFRFGYGGYGNYGTYGKR
jgi:protein-tyrosine kinase